MSKDLEILKRFIGAQNQRLQDDISKQGYKDDSPYKNNPSNTIYGTPQGTPITMKGVSTPLIGMDEFGNKQKMYPGQEYYYPGSQVTETRVAQMGGAGMMYADRNYAEGGKIDPPKGKKDKPLRISDKDYYEYRKQMYSDSLYLHNQGKKVTPTFKPHPQITKEESEKFDKWDEKQPLWSFDEKKYKQDVKNKKFKQFDDYVYDMIKHPTPEDVAFYKSIGEKTITKGDKTYTYQTINNKIDKTLGYSVYNNKTGTDELIDSDGKVYGLYNNRIKPISTKYTGLKTPVVHSEISTKSLSTGWYDKKTPPPSKTLKSAKSYKNYSHETEVFNYYKKPQQPVIFDKNAPKIKLEDQQVSTKSKQFAQPFTSYLQPAGAIQNGLNTNPVTIQQPVRVPQYYDVVDTNNQTFGGGETFYKSTNLSDLNELPTEGWSRKTTPHYQNGGDVDLDAMRGMMKSKIGMGNAFGHPAIRRMSQAMPKTGMTPEGMGTHYMSSMGEYAAPLLQDTGKDQLEYFENPEPSSEDIRFNSPEEAQYFAEHYKEVAPMSTVYNGLQGYQGGGTKKPIYVTSANDPRYEAYSDSLNLYKHTLKTAKNNKNIKLDFVNKNKWSGWSRDADANNFNIFSVRNPFIEPVKIAVRKTSEDIYGKPGVYPIYKKPEQEVIFQRPQDTSIANFIKPASSTFNLEASVPVIRQQVRQPKYYDIEDYTQGSTNYNGSQTNYRTSDLSTLSEQSPNNTRKITPHYQMGGNLPFAQVGKETSEPFKIRDERYEGLTVRDNLEDRNVLGFNNGEASRTVKKLQQDLINDKLKLQRSAKNPKVVIFAESPNDQRLGEIYNKSLNIPHLKKIQDEFFKTKEQIDSIKTNDKTFKSLTKEAKVLQNKFESYTTNLAGPDAKSQRLFDEFNDAQRKANDYENITLYKKILPYTKKLDNITEKFYDEKVNPVTMDSTFIKEGENVKKFYNKTQPGVKVDVVPLYKNKKLLQDKLKGMTQFDKVAFFAHSGRSLSGIPNDTIAKYLDKSKVKDCYFGSCYFEEYLNKSSLKDLKNKTLNYRPNETKTNPNFWYGFNPDAKTFDEGMWSRTGTDHYNAKVTPIKQGVTHIVKKSQEGGEIDNLTQEGIDFIQSIYRNNGPATMLGRLPFNIGAAIGVVQSRANNQPVNLSDEIGLIPNPYAQAASYVMLMAEKEKENLQKFGDNRYKGKDLTKLIPTKEVNNTEIDNTFVPKPKIGKLKTTEQSKKVKEKEIKQIPYKKSNPYNNTEIDNTYTSKPRINDNIKIKPTPSSVLGTPLNKFTAPSNIINTDSFVMPKEFNNTEIDNTRTIKPKNFLKKENGGIIDNDLQQYQIAGTVKLKDERYDNRPVIENTQQYNSVDRKGTLLALKERQDSLKDAHELKTTGQIKRPRSIKYTQSAPRQAQFLKASAPESTLTHALNIATLPLTALKYKMERGHVPDNLVGGMMENPKEINPYDLAYLATIARAVPGLGMAAQGVVQPIVRTAASALGANAFGVAGLNAGNAITSGFATHGAMNIGPDFANWWEKPTVKGFGDVMVDALDMAPAASAIKGSRETVSSLLNKKFIPGTKPRSLPEKLTSIVEHDPTKHTHTRIRLVDPKNPNAENYGYLGLENKSDWLKDVNGEFIRDVNGMPKKGPVEWLKPSMISVNPKLQGNRAQDVLYQLGIDAAQQQKLLGVHSGETLLSPQKTKKAHERFNKIVFDSKLSFPREHFDGDRVAIAHDVVGLTGHTNPNIVSDWMNHYKTINKHFPRNYYSVKDVASAPINWAKANKKDAAVLGFGSATLGMIGDLMNKANNDLDIYGRTYEQQQAEFDEEMRILNIKDQIDSLENNYKSVKNINTKQYGGLTRYQTAGLVKYGTPEYEEAYNRGEVVTEDGQRSPIALDEVVIQGRPLTEFGKTRKEIAKNNTWGQFAQKYLGNFEKNMGQTLENLPESRKQEYEDYINKLTFDEYVKTHPQAKGESRGAYIDRIQNQNVNSSNFEKAYEANAEYNPSTDINLWRKGLMGLGSIALGPIAINKLKQQSDYFSTKEKNYIDEHPVSSAFNTTLGTLAPLEIPANMMHGRNNTWDQALSGRPSDVPIEARLLADPAMLAFEAAPLIGKGLSAAGRALGTEEGLLSNAWKLNRNAEKLNNPDKSYRVAGLDAFEDFKNTGVVRSSDGSLPTFKFADLKGNFHQIKRPTGFPSFQKGYADMRYAPEEGAVVFETALPTYKRGQINPVTGRQIRGRHYAHRVLDPETGAAVTEIPGSEIKVFGDKPHWWKGYPSIDVPAAEKSLIDKLEHNIRFDYQDDYLKRFSDVPVTTKYNNLIKNQELNEINKNRINDLAEHWVYENPAQRVENQKVMEQVAPLFERQKKEAEGIYNMSRQTKLDSINERLGLLQNDPDAIRKNIEIGNEKFIENLQNQAKNNPNYIDELVEQKRQLEEAMSKYGDEYFGNVYDPNFKNLTEAELNARHLEIKAKRDALQNQIQFVKDQVTPAKLHPAFEKKIQNLHGYAGEEVPASIPDVFPIESGMRERNRVVYPRAIPESIADLSSWEQARLLDDQKTAYGINKGVSGNVYSFGENVHSLDDMTGVYNVDYEKVPFKVLEPSTWLGKKTNRIVSKTPSEIIKTVNIRDVLPERLTHTIGHEVGHDIQKFGNWGELITKYSEKFKGHTTHAKNELSKLFQKHMVEPSTTDEMATWHSSGNELHSDLVAERFKIIDKLDADPKKAVEMFRANEDDYTNQIVESGALDAFFKPGTPLNIKKKLVKLLPVAIPAALTVGAMNQNNSKDAPTQKYGGFIKTKQEDPLSWFMS